MIKAGVLSTPAFFLHLKKRGKYVVIINKSESGYDNNVNQVIRENIGDVFERI